MPAGVENDYRIAEGNLRNLDTTTLLRTATVVRNRRDIGDRVDPDAQRSQSTHGRLTPRAWSLDLYIKILDALILGCTTGNFSSDLGSKRRRLA